MNPLAKFIGAVVVALALVASLNPYIAGGLLTIEFIALPLLGLSGRRIARLIWPILVAALFAALTTALYGRTSGQIFVNWGPVLVSHGSLVLALTVALRVLAIGLPGVALFASVDPTDLADSLAQLWKIPQRFVFGALASLRLVDVLVDDWQTLSLARRARGVGSGRGPIAAVTRIFGQIFALLVSSLRRGNTLAIAMEARAFGASRQRTYARQAFWRPRDTWFVAVCGVIGAAIVTASVLCGSGVAGV